MNKENCALKLVNEVILYLGYYSRLMPKNYTDHVLYIESVSLLNAVNWCRLFVKKKGAKLSIFSLVPFEVNCQ